MATVKTIELFFQEGSSDKVYNAEILDDGSGKFTVSVAWGRRGAKLSTGSKAVKVSRADADKMFDKLVREKRGKGYEERTAAHQPTAVVPAEGEGSGSRVTGKRAKVGHAAQLLNAIDDEAGLSKFLVNDAMLAQQKLDGIRVIVHITADGLLATNRDGKITQLAGNALGGLEYLPHGTIVDGEVLGRAYWLFDILQFAGDDVRQRGYRERWEILENELEPALSGDARVLPIAAGTKQKRALHDKLRQASAEGIVFKERDAPYTSGRPSSGGTQRKYKFIKSADVMIVENAGNAYRMCVWDGTQLFDCGRVFAGTTNASRKELDARLGAGETPVAEVKYLYATDDHQLFQPVFVALRADKLGQACLRDQLVRTDRSVL